jgi:hypothetical protein
MRSRHEQLDSGLKLLVQATLYSFFVIWHDGAQTTAARAAGDHGLLFYFKIFVDVFAFYPQLTRAMTVWARGTHENACFVGIHCRHEISFEVRAVCPKKAQFATSGLCRIRLSFTRPKT